MSGSTPVPSLPNAGSLQSTDGFLTNQNRSGTNTVALAMLESIMAQPLTGPAQGDLSAGSITVTNGIARQTKAIQADYQNVLNLGADPTGTVDSAPAFVAAYANLPSTGGLIDVPPGTYLLNSDPAWSGKPVKLRGSGVGITTLVCGSNRTACLTITQTTAAQHVQAHDFTMISTASTQVPYGLQVLAPSYLTTGSWAYETCNVWNVEFPCGNGNGSTANSFATCVNLFGQWNSKVTKVTGRGPTQSNGLPVTGTVLLGVGSSIGVIFAECQSYSHDTMLQFTAYCEGQSFLNPRMVAVNNPVASLAAFVATGAEYYCYGLYASGGEYDCENGVTLTRILNPWFTTNRASPRQDVAGQYVLHFDQCTNIKATDNVLNGPSNCVYTSGILVTGNLCYSGSFHGNTISLCNRIVDFDSAASGNDFRGNNAGASNGNLTPNGYGDANGTNWVEWINNGVRATTSANHDFAGATGSLTAQVQNLTNAIGYVNQVPPQGTGTGTSTALTAGALIEPVPYNGTLATPLIVKGWNSGGVQVQDNFSVSGAGTIVGNGTVDGSFVVGQTLSGGTGTLTLSGVLQHANGDLVPFEDTPASYTPAITFSGGGTVTATVSGWNIRTGRMVSGSGFIQVTALGSASGNLFISLPSQPLMYNAGPYTAPYHAVVIVSHINGLTGITGSLFARVDSTTGAGFLISQSDNAETSGNTDIQLAASNLTTATVLNYEFRYWLGTEE